MQSNPPLTMVIDSPTPARNSNPPNPFLNQRVLSISTEPVLHPFLHPQLYTFSTMTTPTNSPGQKQGCLLNDTELGQGVGKYRKLLTGGRLPAVHAKQLASQGFQIMNDQSGKAVTTSQQHDTAYSPDAMAGHWSCWPIYKTYSTGCVRPHLRPVLQFCRQNILYAGVMGSCMHMRAQSTNQRDEETE